MDRPTKQSLFPLYKALRQQITALPRPFQASSKHSISEKEIARLKHLEGLRQHYAGIAATLQSIHEADSTQAGARSLGENLQKISEDVFYIYKEDEIRRQLRKVVARNKATFLSMGVVSLLGSIATFLSITVFSQGRPTAPVVNDLDQLLPKTDTLLNAADVKAPVANQVAPQVTPTATDLKQSGIEKTLNQWINQAADTINGWAHTVYAALYPKINEAAKALHITLPNPNDVTFKGRTVLIILVILSLSFTLLLTGIILNAILRSRTKPLFSEANFSQDTVRTAPLFPDFGEIFKSKKASLTEQPTQETKEPHGESSSSDVIASSAKTEEEQIADEIVKAVISDLSANHSEEWVFISYYQWLKKWLKSQPKDKEPTNPEIFTEAQKKFIGFKQSIDGKSYREAHEDFKGILKELDSMRAYSSIAAVFEEIDYPRLPLAPMDYTKLIDLDAHNPLNQKINDLLIDPDKTAAASCADLADLLVAYIEYKQRTDNSDLSNSDNPIEDAYQEFWQAFDKIASGDNQAEPTFTQAQVLDHLLQSNYAVIPDLPISLDDLCGETSKEYYVKRLITEMSQPNSHAQPQTHRPSSLTDIYQYYRRNEGVGPQEFVALINGLRTKDNALVFQLQTEMEKFKPESNRMWQEWDQEALDLLSSWRPVAEPKAPDSPERTPNADGNNGSSVQSSSERSPSQSTRNNASVAAGKPQNAKIDEDSDSTHSSSSPVASTELTQQPRVRVRSTSQSDNSNSATSSEGASPMDTQ